MNKRILVVGPVTKDCIITPTSTFYQIGGAVFYQIMTLKQLNYDTISIISIGKNDLEIVENIDVEKELIINKTTTEYTNIYDEQFHRTQKAVLPNYPIKVKDINIDLNRISTVILSPLSPYDIPPETIDYFKENNIETVLVGQGYLRKTDANSNVIEKEWTNKKECLSNTDILCLDENEVKKAFKINDINEETILNILKKYSLKQLIITQAEKGSTIFTIEKTYKIPAIKTEKQVDATGLGDTYISSYIAKLQETDSIYEAGLFASITAKVKLENKGPLKTTKEKIEKELDKYR